MTQKLVFTCWDCWGYNKHHQGDPEFKQEEFDSFSDAHKHLIEYPDHTMELAIKEKEEEE